MHFELYNYKHNPLCLFEKLKDQAFFNKEETQEKQRREMASSLHIQVLEDRVKKLERESKLKDNWIKIQKRKEKNKYIYRYLPRSGKERSPVLEESILGKGRSPLRVKVCVKTGEVIKVGRWGWTEEGDKKFAELYCNDVEGHYKGKDPYGWGGKMKENEMTMEEWQKRRMNM